MNTDTIDKEHLAVMTGRDAELAIEVLDLFREQVQMWRRLIRVDQDRAVWADAAHSLKGSALGIGASELAQHCATAERIGRAEEVPSRVQVAVAINDVLSAMVEADEAAAKLAQSLELRGASAFASSGSPTSVSNASNS